MKEIQKQWWMYAIEYLFIVVLIGVVVAVLFNIAKALF